jgi:hypothetical protein
MPLPLNGHATGIIMKELVRRTIAIVRNELSIFSLRHRLGALRASARTLPADMQV